MERNGPTYTPILSFLEGALLFLSRQPSLVRLIALQETHTIQSQRPCDSLFLYFILPIFHLVQLFTYIIDCIHFTIFTLITIIKYSANTVSRRPLRSTAARYPRVSPGTRLPSMVKPSTAAPTTPVWDHSTTSPIRAILDTSTSPNPCITKDSLP